MRMISCIAVLLALTAYGRIDEKGVEALHAQLALALELYVMEFGELPPLHAPDLARALDSVNPGGVKIYHFEEEDLNAAGEILNQFGDPIRFEFDRSILTITSGRGSADADPITTHHTIPEPGEARNAEKPSGDERSP